MDTLPTPVPYLSLSEEASHQVTAAVVITSWKLVEVCRGSTVEVTDTQT